MIKIKSISKRALALILSMLMLLSSGIVGTLAANVDLAPTGVNHTGGYVYFLKPSTWTESKVMMFIGRNDYTAVFEMTKVSNTDNLYRYNMGSWDNATYVAFANAGSLWGGGNWGPGNRTNATHYTNVYNNYGFNSGSYYVCVPASTSNNANLTINYKSSAANLNLTTIANVYSAASGSTSYSPNAAAGTVSVSGRYMSASNTASTRSAVSSTSSTASASTTLAPGSTATFIATPADGYDFVGWSTSSSETNIVSTNTTYTYKYDISYTGKTVYALFKEAGYSYTVTAGEGGSVSPTGGTGTSVQITATPATGYKFNGWEVTGNGSVADASSATTTLTVNANGVEATASFEKVYSVTVNSAEGGTATAVPDTDVTYGDTVTLTATVTDDAYVFSSWTIVGSYSFVDGYDADDAVTKITVNGSITVTPVFGAKDPHTLTVNQTGGTGVKVDNTTYTSVINTYKEKTHSVSVVAPTDYHIESLKVNGVDVPANKYSNVWTANFTVTIAADTVIDVEFAYNPTVGASLDVAGGKVTVEEVKRDVTNQALPVTYKADVPYEITAPTDYYINEVMVDDTVVFTASANQYELVYNGTIANITANKTIEVDFELIPTLTITVVADTTNGNVTPGAGTYEHQINEVINFTATPNSGYFVEWHVDGSKVGTGTTYNHNVIKSSTVEAKFVEVPWTGEVYLEIASGLCSGDWKNGAYAYTTDNSLGGWPGTQMTYVETLTSGNKVYVVNGVAPLSTLVFKAADVGMQTENIVMEANKNYYILTACSNNGSSWQSTGSWSGEYKYDPDAVMSYVLYGINGSTISDVEKGSYNNVTYRGTTTFPTQDSVTKVDTSNPYYARANFAEGQSVEIITTVIHDDFVVDGWVVNGTKFVEAKSTGTAKEFRGNIPAEYLDEYTNDAVAVYSHSTSWKNAHPNVDTIQVFADISKIADSTVYNWGEYISAYTWTLNDSSGGGYEQFGEWKGQLMIPVGDDQPGVYYTNVEKIGIDGRDVKGIAFTNFGGNSPENPGVGFIQTYDYYEFVTLQDKDNIIYVLQPTDTSVNLSNIGSYTNTSTANNITAMGLNAPLVDYSNDLIDIYRDVLTEEEVAAGEIGLYVVRTGPNLAGTTTNSETLDGEYYIDCYVYDANRKYIGKCKSFELLDLESLAVTNPAFAKLVNNRSDYEGKIVQVFYEAPNTTNQTRVDGEWYGTDGTQNVTLTTRVALKTDSGYQVADSNEATYGSATIGGQGIWTGPQGTQDLKSAITTDSNYKFIGWYHGTLDANGNVVVDTTKDAISIYTDYIFTAYSNSYYVAVFEELASGTIIVNNFSYEGSTSNASAPPVYNKIGRDASFRYVQIDKVDSNYAVIEPGTKSDTYFATADVKEGDILKITIYTAPKYTTTDYVYAWYMEALEDDGTINFEEVGTEDLANFGVGEEASFSFYYEITEDYQKNMIIYSDIVTKTADITLDYRYMNRYDKEVSYTKVYTLLGEELANNAPNDDTVAAYAPYVNDLYKDIKWVIRERKADSTGTRFILEAAYDKEITVNVSVEGKSAATITGEFNEARSLYATDYDDDANPVTNKGFWYVENGEDGEFSEGDVILSYGTYYGLVFTKDMDINYVQSDNLDFKVMLNAPVYGREQATGVDKVYTDFIINYLVPYFSGEIVNGEQIIDVENKNAPVQLKVYADAADVTVEYGMIHQLINTFYPDADKNTANMEDYFNKNGLTETEIETFENFLDSGNASQLDPTSNGNLFNYRYTGTNDLTNKNRALMTFITENTANNRNMYFTAVAYLAITDNTTNETKYYFSNVELFNIKEFVENNKGSDIVE